MQCNPPVVRTISLAVDVLKPLPPRTVSKVEKVEGKQESDEHGQGVIDSTMK